MNDRQPTKPNRIKITFDDGTVKYGYMERADEPTVAGTPLNKANLFNGKNSDRYVCDVPSEAFELIGRVWGPFTLPAGGWISGSDGYYSQTLAVGGMSSKYYPAMVPNYTSAALKDNEKVALSMVDFIVTGDGSITAKATDVPDVAVSFYLVGV